MIQRRFRIDAPGIKKYADTVSWQIAPGGTLLDLENGQTMHSSIGAWEEARSVYVAQSRLDLLRPRTGEPVVLYDIGMGVAANALAFLEAWLEGPSSTPVRIVSFEAHPEALRFALGELGSFPYLRPWTQALEALLVKGKSEGEGWSWELRAGDFREATLGPAPDLIYFDFYAPKVCEELWSTRVFKKLRDACTPPDRECRLITYSAATRVRASLLEAEWFVGLGASTTAKAETTIASTEPRSLELLDRTWLERRPDLSARLGSHPQF